MMLRFNTKEPSGAWQDVGAVSYSDERLTWAENISGLWQTTPHANGDIGGWIGRKMQDSFQAQWWFRFIDTSAYYVMVVNGWKFGE